MFLPYLQELLEILHKENSLRQGVNSNRMRTEDAHRRYDMLTRETKNTIINKVTWFADVVERQTRYLFRDNYLVISILKILEKMAKVI